MLCRSLVVFALLTTCSYAFSLSGTRYVRKSSKFSAQSSPKLSGGAIGWDTHKSISKIPDSLLKEIDGNQGIRAKFEQMCRKSQASICKALEELDGEGKFKEDAWTRETGGGGISRVMANGKVFEKAGVNLSVVYGTMPQEALRAATKRGIDRARGVKEKNDNTNGNQTKETEQNKEGKENKEEARVPFFACGISSVLHPKNPHAPTLHFNYRYFETEGGAWWFGGGTDITPSYLDRDDMKHFHGTYKQVCDKHDAEFYPKFKKWADEYFRIEHRGETRGLGGIFFDDMFDREPEKLLAFANDCLDAVVPAYAPIIKKNANKPFTPEQKRWQQIRRGRYAEFNLVYDRGTIFGLKTGGRIESILMSLPETVRWEYDHRPVPGSPEAEILEVFKKPQDWV